MNPFKFFQDIRIINLEKDKTRMQNVTAEMNKMDIKFTRFNAIETEVGAVGATLSHKQCIQEAKENNKKNLLIFEDDVVFMYDKEKTNKMLEKAIDYLKNRDWDILYLGINLVDVGDNPNNVVFPLEEDLYRIRAGYGAFAYVINSDVFDEYLALIPEEEDISVANKTIIDQILRFKLCSRHKMFLVPLVLMEKNNLSTNQKGIVDYNKSILNRYKKYGIGI